MVSIAIAVYVVLGLLSEVGGLIGYKKANSRASLIAGSIAGGLILLAAAFLALGMHAWGYRLGGLVSILLFARFLPAYLKGKKWMPAGMMTIMSALSIFVTLLTHILG